MDPLLSPSEFVGLDNMTHLCTGGEAPWLAGQSRIYNEFAALTSGGQTARNQLYERVESCRRRMAELWGVPAERIAFMPHAAEAMNWLARGLPWRDGDNVVTTGIEFPSVGYAWQQPGAGVEIRRVPANQWVVGESALLSACDQRTRVLAVSQVSFLTGECLDVERLAAELEGTDTLLAVDATHASGVVQVPAQCTDLCVSSAYKWMLATHGTAPCYVSERAEALVADSCFGWRNLETPLAGVAVPERLPLRPMPLKLEPGNPAVLSILFLGYALDVLLGIGMRSIENHARTLALTVNEGLQQIGITVISPRSDAQRSGNTCFLTSDPVALCARLASERVLVWGDHSRVRVSTHLYNGAADVDRLLEVLAAIH
jgi:selenocysteine lyase/cysteine desulfurase